MLIKRILGSFFIAQYLFVNTAFAMQERDDFQESHVPYQRLVTPSRSIPILDVSQTTPDSSPGSTSSGSPASIRSGASTETPHSTPPGHTSETSFSSDSSPELAAVFPPPSPPKTALEPARQKTDDEDQKPEPTATEGALVAPTPEKLPGQQTGEAKDDLPLTPVSPVRLSIDPAILKDARLSPFFQKLYEENLHPLHGKAHTVAGVMGGAASILAADAETNIYAYEMVQFFHGHHAGPFGLSTVLILLPLNLIEGKTFAQHTVHSLIHCRDPLEEGTKKNNKRPLRITVKAIEKLVGVINGLTRIPPFLSSCSDGDAMWFWLEAGPLFWLNYKATTHQMENVFTRAFNHFSKGATEDIVRKRDLISTRLKASTASLFERDALTIHNLHQDVFGKLDSSHLDLDLAEKRLLSSPLALKEMFQIGDDFIVKSAATKGRVINSLSALLTLAASPTRYIIAHATIKALFIAAGTNAPFLGFMALPGVAEGAGAVAGTVAVTLKGLIEFMGLRTTAHNLTKTFDPSAEDPHHYTTHPKTRKAVAVTSLAQGGWMTLIPVAVAYTAFGNMALGGKLALLIPYGLAEGSVQAVRFHSGQQRLISGIDNSPRLKRVVSKIKRGITYPVRALAATRPAQAAGNWLASTRVGQWVARHTSGPEEDKSHIIERDALVKLGSKIVEKFERAPDEVIEAAYDHFLAAKHPTPPETSPGVWQQVKDKASNLKSGVSNIGTKISGWWSRRNASRTNNPDIEMGLLSGETY